MQTTLHTTEPDLFHHPEEDWVEKPAQSYQVYLNGLKRSASTEAVYRTMFNKYLRWCDSKHLHWLDTRWEDIAAFLDEAGIVKEHRYRYVRLLERLWQHLILKEVASVNPGSQAALRKVGKGKNDPTVFLSEQETSRLEGLIGLSLPAAWQRPAALGSDEWLAVRDAVLVGILYGAGLKLGEALALGVNITWSKDESWLELPWLKGVPGRRVRLLPIGVRALEAWMPWRDLSKTAFLPAHTAKRRADHKSSRHAMSPMTAWRRVGAFLARADIQGQRASAQTLRNSYAAALFLSGLDNHAVAESMGFLLNESAAKLKVDWELSTGRRQIKDYADEEME